MGNHSTSFLCNYCHNHIAIYLKVVRPIAHKLTSFVFSVTGYNNPKNSNHFSDWSMYQAHQTVDSVSLQRKDSDSISGTETCKQKCNLKL